MASKTVEWTSFNRLSCAGCAPADVIICTTFTPSTVPAQMISFQPLNNGCGQKFYRYVFNYDTDDLPVGVTGITCANILGVFCKGCLTTWIEELTAAGAAALAVLQAEVDALEVQVDALQVEVDALEVTVGALETQVDVLEANPKAETFQGQSFQLGYSFTLNPGTPFDLDLIVTNPSSVNSMAVVADYGWDLSLVSASPYSPSGATSQLFQDAVLVPNSDREANENWTPAGIRAANFTGGTGQHHFIIGPGGSVTLTLTLTEEGGGPGPDIGWGVEHIYLSAFGVTI